MNRIFLKLLLCISFVCIFVTKNGYAVDSSSNLAGNNIEIIRPWARATVTGQKQSGVFLDIKSKVDVDLISASSNVAKDVEIHEMTMNDNNMYMHEIKQLHIPAGKVVSLQNNYHIMLFGLKKVLKVNDIVKVDLFFLDSQKKKIKKSLDIVVKPIYFSEK